MLTRRCFLATFVIVALAAPSLYADQSTWKAGTAKVVITPDKPMWMAGYGSRTKPADGKQPPTKDAPKDNKAPDGKNGPEGDEAQNGETGADEAAKEPAQQDAPVDAKASDEKASDEKASDAKDSDEKASDAKDADPAKKPLPEDTAKKTIMGKLASW